MQLWAKENALSLSISVSFLKTGSHVCQAEDDLEFLSLLGAGVPHHASFMHY